MRTPDIRRESADGTIVVTDRSVLSCILFQDTIRRLMPHIPNAYQYCLEAFLRAHDSGEVIFPNSLIYLEANNIETFNERVGRRGRTPIDFLSSEEAYYFTREWFSQLISQYYAPDNSILLQSEDGKLDELIANAMTFLHNSSYQGDTRLMLESLLADCNRLEVNS
jgi:deoxyadenosine/deoxycytidine kinase